MAEHHSQKQCYEHDSCLAFGSVSFQRGQLTKITQMGDMQPEANKKQQSA